MQKLAIFDVDGTLFEGNLGIEFLKNLLGQKLFPEEIGKAILDWYTKYKSGEVEKAIVVDEIYKLYSQGMKGMTVEVATKVARETFGNVTASIYPFAKELTEKLGQQEYMLILLSGSPIEMVTELAGFLKIPSLQISAGTLEVQNGVYTGKIISYPGSAEQKEVEITKLIERLGIEVDWSRSLAMGDNERDQNILQKVGAAIAFEPNDVLKKLAEVSGWKTASRENILQLLLEADN
ncbi:MAG: HAD-IB family phosphatase [Candidatus Doudnabacteria bacterium]|nr:HAD-IB family phosphatase [Candidatus Doudnabacteria bacterium]